MRAGSLATPPCSEVVSWVVMGESIAVSQEQIDAFAALYPMNARPVQPSSRSTDGSFSCGSDEADCRAEPTGGLQGWVAG